MILNSLQHSDKAEITQLLFARLQTFDKHIGYYDSDRFPIKLLKSAIRSCDENSEFFKKYFTSQL